MNGVGGWPVVSAVLGAAVEIKRGAVLPSGNDAFAKFVFVDLRRNRGLRDFRKREAVALLHVENRVVAENERNAVILAGGVFFILSIFGKLFIEDNRRSMLAFADTNGRTPLLGSSGS